MAQRTRERVLPLTGQYGRTDTASSAVGLSMHRWAEAVPGTVSRVVVLAPVWLTLIDFRLGVAFVVLATIYFATLMPAAGAIVVNLILRAAGLGSIGAGAGATSLATSVLLSVVSVLGILSFGQVLLTRELVQDPQPAWRVGVEFVLFWLVFPFYVPVVTAIAGMKTSTAYLLGKRPRGHYDPTPK